LPKGKQSVESPTGRKARGTKAGGSGALPRSAATGVFLNSSRIEAIMTSAQRSGLLDDKGGRIGGRLSATLIERAKANTGIATDTELLEFALASVALEDNFAEAFQDVRATVDPSLKLGF
jgi:hypothetical protein